MIKNIDSKLSYREMWDEAYKKASFFKSDKNTKEYWDKVAEADGGGLAGDGHIRLIKEYLLSEGLIDGHSTVLDVGCGGGDYVVSLAETVGHVTAMDYSGKMLNLCRNRCEKAGLSNVSFVQADFMEADASTKFDCVLACLNPSTYRPDALDKLMTMAKDTVVSFTMDIPLENADEEPIYRGSNSVRFAERYLKEKEALYFKIPYEYDYKMDKSEVRKINFAYLVIKKKESGKMGFEVKDCTDVEVIKELFKEYSQIKGAEGCFVSFDKELADLKGFYSGGALLEGCEDGRAVACIAIKKINDDTCEAKRLFIKPEYRGKGYARVMLNTMLKRAAELGFKEVTFTTKPAVMSIGYGLYKRMGFEQVSENDGTVAMRMELEGK